MKWHYTCKDCGVNVRKVKVNFCSGSDELWKKYGVGKGEVQLLLMKSRENQSLVDELPYRESP